MAREHRGRGQYQAVTRKRQTNHLRDQARRIGQNILAGLARETCRPESPFHSRDDLRSLAIVARQREIVIDVIAVRCIVGSQRQVRIAVNPEYA